MSCPIQRISKTYLHVFDCCLFYRYVSSPKFPSTIVGRLFISITPYHVILNAQGCSFRNALEIFPVLILKFDPGRGGQLWSYRKGERRVYMASKQTFLGELRACPKTYSCCMYMVGVSPRKDFLNP